jgi:hypothetical protein
MLAQSRPAISANSAPVLTNAREAHDAGDPNGQLNVTAANTLTRNSATRMAFTLEVKSLDALARVLLRDVRGVFSAGPR